MIWKFFMKILSGIWILCKWEKTFVNQGISCSTTPFWEFLMNWRGVVRLNFSKKKTKLENFFHIFFCTPNKNTVKIDYYSSAENIFHILTKSNNFYTHTPNNVYESPQEGGYGTKTPFSKIQKTRGVTRNGG